MESKKENELLIKAVYKRNAIWNKQNPNYSNLKAVTKLWEEISIEINFPIEVIEERWRNLRDFYRAELRKIEKYSHNNLILKSNWHYFNMLSFLKDQINCNSFTLNIENKDMSMIESENKLDIFFNSRDLDFENINLFRDEIYENKESIVNDYIESSIDSTVPKSSFSNDSISELCSERNLQQIKKQRLKFQAENKLAKGGTKNEIEAFFASLIPHMSNMAPEQKLLCRIELQKIVYNYAYSFDS